MVRLLDVWDGDEGPCIVGYNPRLLRAGVLRGGRMEVWTLGPPKDTQ